MSTKSHLEAISEALAAAGDSQIGGPGAELLVHPVRVDGMPVGGMSVAAAARCAIATITGEPRYAADGSVAARPLDAAEVRRLAEMLATTRSSSPLVVALRGWSATT